MPSYIPPHDIDTFFSVVNMIINNDSKENRRQYFFFQLTLCNEYDFAASFSFSQHCLLMQTTTTTQKLQTNSICIYLDQQFNVSEIDHQNAMQTFIYIFVPILKRNYKGFMLFH